MFAEGEVSAEHPAQEVEGGSFLFHRFGRMGKPLAQRKLFGFIAVPQEPIVPDFHKAGWKYVHKEAPDELISGDGHGLPTVVIPVVAPFESDLSVLDVKDSIVRDGDAVGVSPEILNDAKGGVKRWLAVDDPFLMVAIIE